MKKMPGEKSKNSALLLWGFKHSYLPRELEAVPIIEESPLSQAFDFFLCGPKPADEAPEEHLFGRPINELALSYKLADHWQKAILSHDIPWKEDEKVARMETNTLKRLKQLWGRYRRVTILADTSDVASLLVLWTWLKLGTTRKKQKIEVWLYFRNGLGDKDTPAMTDEVVRFVLLKRFEQLSVPGQREGNLILHLLAPQYFVPSHKDDLKFCFTAIQSALWLEFHVHIQSKAPFSAAACALLRRHDEQRQTHVKRWLLASFHNHFSGDLEATVSDWGWSKLAWNMLPPQFPSLEALEDHLRQNVYLGTGYNQTLEKFIQTGLKAFASHDNTVTAEMFTIFVEEQGASFFSEFRQQFSAQWKDFIAYKIKELNLRATLAPEKRKTIFVRFIEMLSNLRSIIGQICSMNENAHNPPVSDLLVQLILRQNGFSDKPRDFWETFLMRTVADPQKSVKFIEEVDIQARQLSFIPFERMVQFQALNELSVKFSVKETTVLDLAFGGKVATKDSEKINNYFQTLLKQALFRELRQLERQANVQDIVLQSRNQQAWYSTQLALPWPKDLLSDYVPVDAPLQGPLLLLYNQISGLRLEEFVFGAKLLSRTRLALETVQNKERFPLILLRLFPDLQQALLEKIAQIIVKTARKTVRFQWQWEDGRIIKKKQSLSFLNMLENEMKRLPSAKTEYLFPQLTNSEKALTEKMLSYLQKQREAPELAEFLASSRFGFYLAIPSFRAGPERARAHI